MIRKLATHKGFVSSTFMIPATADAKKDRNSISRDVILSFLHPPLLVRLPGSLVMVIFFLVELIVDKVVVILLTATIGAVTTMSFVESEVKVLLLLFVVVVDTAVLMVDKKSTVSLLRLGLLLVLPRRGGIGSNHCRSIS